MEPKSEKINVSPIAASPQIEGLSLDRFSDFDRFVSLTETLDSASSELKVIGALRDQNLRVLSTIKILREVAMEGSQEKKLLDSVLAPDGQFSEKAFIDFVKLSIDSGYFINFNERSESTPLFAKVLEQGKLVGNQRLQDLYGGELPGTLLEYKITSFEGDGNNGRNLFGVSFINLDAIGDGYKFYKKCMEIL